MKNDGIIKNELIGEKPSLIHFWSVSCHLCKLEMPSLKELQEKFGNQINVIGIHIPRSVNDLDLDKIKETAENHLITHPVFIDQELTLTDDYENEYVPAYYLFDKHGKLRHFQAGARGMSLLTKRVSRILNLK